MHFIGFLQLNEQIEIDNIQVTPDSVKLNNAPIKPIEIDNIKYETNVSE